MTGPCFFCMRFQNPRPPPPEGADARGGWGVTYKALARSAGSTPFRTAKRKKQSLMALLFLFGDAMRPIIH